MDIVRVISALAMIPMGGASALGVGRSGDRFGGVGSGGGLSGTGFSGLGFEASFGRVVNSSSAS